MARVGFVSKIAACMAAAVALGWFDWLNVQDAEGLTGNDLARYWAFSGAVMVVTVLPLIKELEIASRFLGWKISVQHRYRIAIPAIAFAALVWYVAYSITHMVGYNYGTQTRASMWLWFIAWGAIALALLGETAKRFQESRRVDTPAAHSCTGTCQL